MSTPTTPRTSALPGLRVAPTAATTSTPTVQVTRRPRRTADELRAVVEEAAPRLADAGAQGVAAWAVQEFGGWLAVACSMADAVLPHLVAQAGLAAGVAPVDVLFLDTGYHFAETLATRDLVAARLPVRVVDVTPRLSVAEQDAAHGVDLYARDPGACCRMRKVEPLTEQLAGYEAWVTGVRREEAPTRAGTPVVTWDAAHGLVKINPLAAWTFDELLAYAAEHEVPLNPLLDDGYPSIGCRPCTSRVAPGADPRSGRWAGLAKTECGIHP
ncbi:phosphoadenylyl-sulfate reductase [Cellulomonas sp. P24]|uniref:phosphoadenylyl-sulfate reductase n=1 Tax=Cellulomonas sp. P24 TaxID=2885206 RepID=UPI00216B6065|nr:phosphoadenylyl-sulfate reductase [Cellulomonas sp. P24]MCR6492185.1 phosphoadenylyl-sulfate reductase [Cellulomonas sp. P24]